MHFISGDQLQGMGAWSQFELHFTGGKGKILAFMASSFNLRYVQSMLNTCGNLWAAVLELPNLNIAMRNRYMHKPLMQRLPLVIVMLFSLTACQSAYYGAMEKVGIHKRDIMVDRVEDARDAQEDAKEEFKSALHQFQQMFGKPDTGLQDQYDRLNAAYEDSEDAANEVTDRIESVENVSEALFEEWEEELNLYTSQTLKNDSAAKLRATRRQYNGLIGAMRAAEKRMQPVLNSLRDQVLYLKHNLNARAIDGLKGELKSVEGNVARLIKDMEKSIAESEAFIAQLQQG